LGLMGTKCVIRLSMAFEMWLRLLLAMAASCRAIMPDYSVWLAGWQQTLFYFIASLFVVVDIRRGDATRRGDNEYQPAVTNARTPRTP
jgi:hypothetical protein